MLKIKQSEVKQVEQIQGELKQNIRERAKRKNKAMQIKEEGGITLIALVITIIVEAIVSALPIRACSISTTVMVIVTAMAVSASPFLYFDESRKKH